MTLRAELGRGGWLRVLALAVAAWVGLGDAGRAAVAPPQRFTFEVAGVADRTYGPVRPLLAPGELVGLLIPGRSEADDQVRWFTAQYALAPAVLVPVRLAACATSLAEPLCAVASRDRVLAAGVPPAQVGPLGEALGLAPLRQVGPVVVYGRRSP